MGGGRGADGLPYTSAGQRCITCVRPAVPHSPQGPDMADLLAPLPRVRAWLGRVRDACSPHYDGGWVLHQSCCAVGSYR